MFRCGITPRPPWLLASVTHFQSLWLPSAQCIDYSPITSMYGAVHCSSQVVKRSVKRTTGFLPA